MGGELTLEDRVQGPGGRKRPRWRHEAHTWATQQGWVVRWVPTDPPAHRNTERIAIELGSGWEGASEGLRMVWDRVLTLDQTRHTLTKAGSKTTPDFVTTFQQAASHRQGICTWMASKGGASPAQIGGVWVSADCTVWSTAQGFQKDTGQGTYGTPQEAAQNISEPLKDLQAIMTGIRNLQATNPRVQYAFEQPAYSEARHHPWILANLGEGIVVAGCAYGERKSGKMYRLWLSPGTAACFTPRDPTGPDSLCLYCTRGEDHPHAYSPRPHQQKQRVSLAGYTNKAARNRVPPHLAEAVSIAMIEAQSQHASAQ